MIQRGPLPQLSCPETVAVGRGLGRELVGVWVVQGNQCCGADSPQLTSQIPHIFLTSFSSFLMSVNVLVGELVIFVSQRQEILLLLNSKLSVF